jgi:hypothetical protein
VTLNRQDDGAALVHLTDDFEVGPSPCFRVYPAEAAPIDDADFKASGQLDLGRLCAFKGSRVYMIPPGTAPAATRASSSGARSSVS